MLLLLLFVCGSLLYAALLFKFITGTAEEDFTLTSKEVSIAKRLKIRFDGGMWVCLCMRSSDNLAGYDVGPCGDVDLMRLALDMVGALQNDKMEKMIRRAHKHSTTGENMILKDMAAMHGDAYV
ncbi:unnamed protein product [Linum trigynum]|uniref:Uncharacterized protein n=1 Tax=Linum trigynum TaxID=586398 RepID=A0AAV2GN17_9ROSI